MKIAFNPSTVAALTTPPNNKDITFDLRGRNIFARGVKFYGTDTNTWRDIKINNVSIGSNILDLRNGSNTTLTNINGVVTINSTWRPVVDNLTSDSTTSSLSAKQGKVLKALIDGKSNSDHNHDGRYVRYYAVTTLNCNNLAPGLTVARTTTNAALDYQSAYLYISEVGTPFQIQIPDSSILYIYKRYYDYDSGGWSGWFKLNAGYADSAGSVAWANVTGKPSSYTPSAHTHDDRYYTKAESNAKYITDITTSVNKLTFTRNGSNIIRDITVNVVHSQGYLTNIPNKDATTKASPGLLIYNSYEQTIGTNFYSSVLSINTGGTIQIAGNWGDDQARNLYWRSQSDKNVADYPWKSWRTILDSENYSSTLDSRYYTESEVNSLLSRKLDRVNLTTGNWNPRGYHLAADYNYNGGDLSISENNGKMYISVDGCFWQNEGQYRVLDTSDIGDIRDSVTLHQYLSAIDATWYPLVWGGAFHNNTHDSTGPVYKSYDRLSWQTSSQTLYATNIQTNNIKNLSIGGGIYWSPYAESTTDNTEAASITVVRSGVAGGTTLVLSQMNDTNDTIQFKTNTAARLYHNNYPILTTQNTYVNNNKGYINGTEITQVNNADMVDGYHENSFLRYRGATNTNQKATLWSQIGIISYGNALPDGLTGVYNWGSVISLPGQSSRFEIYASHRSSSGNGLYYRSGWGDDKRPWLKFIDSSNIGSQSVNYANSAGSVAWANVTGKPSSYTPSAHNHDGRYVRYYAVTTLNCNNLMEGLTVARTSTNAALDYQSAYLYIVDVGTSFQIQIPGSSMPYIYKRYYDYDSGGWSGWFKLNAGYADSAGHANSAGNADTLGGIPRNYGQAPFGTIPSIGNDGVMEIGRYIDFHSDNSGSYDYSTRIQATGNYKNTVNLPSASGTLALINDVNNYYWANIKISTSSSTTTSPTFYTVYLGNRDHSIYNGPNDSANGVGGPLNNLVFSSWYGVSFTTSCAGMTYTNKNAVSINCRTGQLYAREVQANGFMHTGHNNNDAVLLAGGGYKTLKDFIFLNKSYSYTDGEYYNLAFYKLSGICNNLVWVDGHVKGYIAKSFVIDPAFFPYRYDEDSNLNTIYLMSGKNYITINAIGVVTINNATDNKQRVGFFYTGRA